MEKKILTLIDSIFGNFLCKKSFKKKHLVKNITEDNITSVLSSIHKNFKSVLTILFSENVNTFSLVDITPSSFYDSWAFKTNKSNIYSFIKNIRNPIRLNLVFEKKIFIPIGECSVLSGYSSIPSPSKILVSESIGLVRTRYIVNNDFSINNLNSASNYLPCVTIKKCIIELESEDIKSSIPSTTINDPYLFDYSKFFGKVDNKKEQIKIDFLKEIFILTKLIQNKEVSIVNIDYSVTNSIPETGISVIVNGGDIGLKYRYFGIDVGTINDFKFLNEISNIAFSILKNIYYCYPTLDTESSEYVLKLFSDCISNPKIFNIPIVKDFYLSLIDILKLCHLSESESTIATITKFYFFIGRNINHTTTSDNDLTDYIGDSLYFDNYVNNCFFENPENILYQNNFTLLDVDKDKKSPLNEVYFSFKTNKTREITVMETLKNALP